jgi:hypothetical protein
VDESGIDNREDYPYGWCEKGERFHALKSGRRQQRVSIVAGLRGENLIAPLTFEVALKSPATGNSLKAGWNSNFFPF